METKENKKNEKVIFSVKNLIEKTTKNLKSNSGKNESIYKKQIYVDVPKEKQKNLRTKLRKITENFAKSIIAEKDANKLKDLIRDFSTYYSEIYLVNDYSVNSICSNNTDAETKELYKKMFEKIEKNK